MRHRFLAMYAGTVALLLLPVFHLFGQQANGPTIFSVSVLRAEPESPVPVWLVQEKESPPPRKAPRALLMSVAVPGLGQVYNKNYLKAAAFLGVEIASWFIYFDQTAEGNRLQDEFEAFADAHWYPDRYWSALANESGCDPNDLDCLKQWERSNFSHHLPDEKNQTYYENIGKYDQFNIGWEDAQKHRSRDSQLREKYTFMRKDSNDAFEMARLGATIVLLNHIVSALEAGYTAHKEDQRVRHALRVIPRKVRNEIVPALALRLTW